MPYRRTAYGMSTKRYCVVPYLSGGDDYELCFTAPNARRSEIEAVAAKLRLPLTRIGRVVGRAQVHGAGGRRQRDDNKGKRL